MSYTIRKRLIIGFSILGAFCVICVFFANSFVEKKLENTLKTLPESVRFNYSALHVNVFQGMLFVENPELELIEGAERRVDLKIILEDFKLTNVSYWEYVVNNTIHLDSVLLNNAQIFYVRSKEKTKDSVQVSSNSKSQGLKKFDKVVKIDNFDLNHATVTLYKGSKDSVFVKSENASIRFNDIYFDDATALEGVPFKYSDYRVLTDSLKFNVGKFETLRLSELEFTKNYWVIRDLKLKTKYSKRELTKFITKERDHFDVEMDSLYIKGPQFGAADKRIYFNTDTITIQKPIMKIYRNKMVADDYSVKPLYSKMLRDLKFDLTLPVLILKDGYIEYEEKVKEGIHAGSISFNDFNATIKNVSNTYTSPTKTELDINTNFFDTAPLHALWTFDVNNEKDEFNFKTEIGLLPVSQLNKFTEHNLNIKLEGQFDEIYANINGNVNRSHVDFSVKYEDMKLQILNKKHQKNKFLSSVANLFLRNDSDKNDDGFITKSGQVERDKTKSVFNFFWLNVKEGLKLVFVGDGII
ncbi:conserved hypothetical protein [Formosa agariphila KMM 3901]|uniref:DUF748 domain-containing protein n=1 Tax=Formosa agariphila (strain DSM 15362 / KCTC 12365 / LMG 23005 / KMM 3901 / M-2Alg 35-1) TaxID=1347342 RepID=T2KJ89_FORAG|nr:hypothetical protein [Formosa agariphila]CDF78835.1 conserved hypothetical protein [Formosa agariphila KMM 3901]